MELKAPGRPVQKAGSKARDQRPVPVRAGGLEETSVLSKPHWFWLTRLAMQPQNQEHLGLGNIPWVRSQATRSVTYHRKYGCHPREPVLKYISAVA